MSKTLNNEIIWQELGELGKGSQGAMDKEQSGGQWLGERVK